MKITPIEIRQHKFEKTFRGYTVEEVDAFLGSLSNEWERAMNESKMMKMQLEIAERDLNKLKEVEMQLFRSLKTADEDREQIVSHANQAAQTTLNEARAKADELLSEAQQQATNIEADARRKAAITRLDAENQAKFLREDLLNELKSQDRDLKGMERYRDNLLVQLRSLANNTTDSLERFEKKFLKGSVAEKINEVKTQIKESDQAVKAAQTDLNALAILPADTAEEPPAETENLSHANDQQTPPNEAETSEPEDHQAIPIESPQPAELPEVAEDKPEEMTEGDTNKSGSFFDNIP